MPTYTMRHCWQKQKNFFFPVLSLKYIQNYPKLIHNLAIKIRAAWDAVLVNCILCELDPRAYVNALLQLCRRVLFWIRGQGTNLMDAHSLQSKIPLIRESPGHKRRVCRLHHVLQSLLCPDSESKFSCNVFLNVLENWSCLVHLFTTDNDH